MHPQPLNCVTSQVVQEGDIIKLVPSSATNCSGAAALDASHGGAVSHGVSSFALPGGQQYALCVSPAGRDKLTDDSFVFFDKTIISVLHLPPEAPLPSLLRLVAYIAMMPRSRASARQLEQRRDAVRRGTGSGHDPLKVRASVPSRHYRAPASDDPRWRLV